MLVKFAIPAFGRALTIYEKKNCQQFAGKVNPIVQSQREVETRNLGEPCSNKFSPGLFILKIPILEEPTVDFSSDLINDAVAFVLEERWAY